MCEPRSNGQGGDQAKKRRRSGFPPLWDARNPEAGGPQEGNGDRGARRSQPWWKYTAPTPTS